MSLRGLLTAAQMQVHVITRKGNPDFKIYSSLKWWLQEEIVLKIVAPRGNCPARAATTPTQPCSSDLYRCLKRRLGHPLIISYSKRGLVSDHKQFAHKLPVTEGSLLGPKGVPRPLFKQDGAHCNRQHQSCCLHKQGKRHEVGPSVCPSVENLDLVLQETGQLNVVAKLSRWAR